MYLQIVVHTLRNLLALVFCTVIFSLPDHPNGEQQANSIRHQNGCKCGKRSRLSRPRQILGEIPIDLEDDSDEPNGKNDSTETGHIEGVQSSESEEEKPASVVSNGSMGKSDAEDETKLNLRLASEPEDETDASSDVDKVRQDSDSMILLDRRPEKTGNAYFRLRVLTWWSLPELSIWHDLKFIRQKIPNIWV